MSKNTYILGISGGFSPGSYAGSAALLRDNEVIAAVEEERLVRLKHAFGLFPKKSIEYCLKTANIQLKDIHTLAFHVDSYAHIKEDIQDYLRFHFGVCPNIALVNHHLAHAACAYFLSGFKEANIVTIDYSGDGISTTLCIGSRNTIKRLESYPKPNSLGIFYAIMTQFLGFHMDSDEYKVMGLASYGTSHPKLRQKMDRILSVTNSSYTFRPKFLINTPTRQQRRFSDALISLLGPNRKSAELVTQHHKDLAKTAQDQFEEACMALLKKISELNPSRNLCLSGGAALNCVANGRLLHSGLVDNIYVPPAPGDNGAALGAALQVGSQLGLTFSKLLSPFLGPSFDNNQIKEDLVTLKLPYRYFSDTTLLPYVAKEINRGKIIGWFQGRMEFGPRALGNRSILATPSDPAMKDKLNKYIKFRESFRPFAPSVIREAASTYFENASESPYMSFTFNVLSEKIPAVTHVDGTARVQTVSKSENPKYHALLKEVGKISGIPMVLNTSLNIMDQPIACTPKDALSIFGGTGIDMLVLDNYVLEK